MVKSQWTQKIDRIPSHDYYYYHFLSLQLIDIPRRRAPYYSEYFHVFRNFQRCFLFKFVGPSVATFGWLLERFLLWHLCPVCWGNVLLIIARSPSAHTLIAFVQEFLICILLSRCDFFFFLISSGVSRERFGRNWVDKKWDGSFITFTETRWISVFNWNKKLQRSAGPGRMKN